MSSAKYWRGATSRSFVRRVVAAMSYNRIGTHDDRPFEHSKRGIIDSRRCSENESPNMYKQNSLNPIQGHRKIVPNLEPENFKQRRNRVSICNCALRMYADI